MIRMIGSVVKSLNNQRSIWIFSCILSLLLATGCMTTTVEGSSQQPAVDKEKALETRLQLAIGYLGKGEHERAREHLNKAMKINSRSAELHDVWALLYQQEMELETAESHYKKALSYDPTFTRGRNNYGLFLLRLDRVEEAYQQFVKGSEDLDYSKRAELLYKVGITALKLGRLQEAEKAFTKAAILRPKMSEAYFELAEIAYDRADYPRSKQLLDRYDETKRRVSSRGLWLGIRLDNSFGNQDAEASQGMALRNLFPDSQENQEYQSWLKNERKKP
jgi:type IV pilus assembly protein PilF